MGSARKSPSVASPQRNRHYSVREPRRDSRDQPNGGCEQTQGRNKVNEYLVGYALQLRERAKHLIGLIPRNHGRDLDGLIAVSRSALGDSIENLEQIASDPEMHLPHFQGMFLRKTRRAVDELDWIETSVISVLARWNPLHDGPINSLVDRLAREIQFPLSTPVVACTSRKYYCIHPRWNLMEVPLAENQFLLHLPDLCHELGHPLITTKNDPKTEPFKQEYLSAVTEAQAYVLAELQRDNTGRSPVAFGQILPVWHSSWVDWANELFCDLLATYTLGPSFAWAHFHLHASRGGNPFYVPEVTRTIHPADAARMEVMLVALDKIGYAAEGANIRSRWEKLLATSNAISTPQYRRCFPLDLLRRIAQRAYDGTTHIGCKLAFSGMTELCSLL